MFVLGDTNSIILSWWLTSTLAGDRGISFSVLSSRWCVFWMDEETIASRVNISLVGILSVVAYYFVILGNVPKIPYLTMMDAFMISTFLMLAATVVISFA